MAINQSTRRDIRSCPGVCGTHTSRRHRRLMLPTTVRLPSIRTDTRAGAARVPVRFRRAPVKARRAISTNILDVRVRVLVIEAARGRQRAADSDPGHGSVHPLERRTVPESPDSRFETHGPVGPRGQTGGQHSVVRRLLRLTGTSGRPPIGSPQRVPGAHRPRVTSGRPVLRLRCQSTSRPAFVPETPNAEARGCVRRRRTSRGDGRW